MSEEYGGSGNALTKEAGDVFGIPRAVVSASHTGGLAMTAKVRRNDMPAQTQRGNHRQKYLPASAKSMEQHQRRPMGRAFGVVQLNFAGIESALDEAWMVFTHNFRSGHRRTQPHRLAASAS